MNTILAYNEFYNYLQWVSYFQKERNYNFIKFL